MERNDNTFGLIPYSEMRAYISTGVTSTINDDHYRQHLLRGWMKFVAPLTPSSVDQVPNLKCVQEAVEPVEHVPESIFAILWAIALSETCELLPRVIVPLMRKAWPTMWIWIQHIYQTHLRLALPGVDATRKAFMSKRYEVFVTILRMFVDHGHTPMVSGFISGHTGILPMMADMWIKEGTYKNAGNGFRSALFNVPRVAIQERFLTQIILACGTADEAVHVACQRVEHHLGQAQRDYDVLCMDLGMFVVYFCEPSGSPLATAMYASSGLATTLMHAWAHSTSSLCTASVANRSELLGICMTATSLLVHRSPQAYDRTLDILHHDLLPLLVQSVALIQPSSDKYESFTAHAVSTIHEILSPATVHRETLSLLGRCVAAVHKQGKHLPMRNPSIRNTWSGLMMLLDEREKVYNKFKADSRTVLLCGNAKCENPNSGMFHRCSACRILLYCSQKCQRAHWNEHKILCNNMKGTAKGCIDLSYPNLKFLSYLVVYEMVAKHSSYIASVGDTSITRNTLPFFFLDYVKLAGFVSSIELMNANERKPFLPLSGDNALYKRWCQLLVLPREAPAILVAIPRGANGTA